MRKTSLFLLCALAAMAQQTTNQRPGTIMSGMLSSSVNGAHLKVSYSTVVEPASQRSALRISGGTSGFDPSHVLHRYVVDETNLQYFGYDMEITPGVRPGYFTVKISPLSLSPTQFRLHNPSVDPTRLVSVPLPTYPPPQDVKDGDTIAIDLLASSDGKTKVVDYFQVSGSADGAFGSGASGAVVSTYSGRIAPDSSSAVAGSIGEPRDYSLDDGAPHFDLAGGKVSVNGQSSAALTITGKPGATMWIAPPYQGRYILSLLPREGFQKAGAIRGNTLSFDADGQRFEIRLTSPVLARGAWNLYVMHDRQYQSNQTSVSIGTDRLENLVPRQ